MSKIIVSIIFVVFVIILILVITSAEQRKSLLGKLKEKSSELSFSNSHFLTELPNEKERIFFSGTSESNSIRGHLIAEHTLNEFQWNLIFQGKDGTQYKYPFDSESKDLVVGRASGSDIQIRNPYVSRQHFIIGHDDKGPFLKIATKNDGNKSILYRLNMEERQSHFEKIKDCIRIYDGLRLYTGNIRNSCFFLFQKADDFEDDSSIKVYKFERERRN